MSSPDSAKMISMMPISPKVLIRCSGSRKPPTSRHGYGSAWARPVRGGASDARRTVTGVTTARRRGWPRAAGRPGPGRRPDRPGRDRRLRPGPGDARPGRAPRPRSSSRAAPRRSSRVLRVASRHGVPVVPRGAGSGPGGAANAVDGCITLVMTRMDAVLEVVPGRPARRRPARRGEQGAARRRRRARAVLSAGPGQLRLVHHRRQPGA